MSNSKNNSSKTDQIDNNLEELKKSTMDVIAGFRNMEREIRMGMVSMAQEIEQLDSALKNIRQNIREEIKIQVDDYLREYLSDIRKNPIIDSKMAFDSVKKPDRAKPTKSPVPPHKLRKSGS